MATKTHSVSKSDVSTFNTTKDVTWTPSDWSSASNAIPDNSVITALSLKIEFYQLTANGNYKIIAGSTTLLDEQSGVGDHSHTLNVLNYVTKTGVNAGTLTSNIILRVSSGLVTRNWKNIKATLTWTYTLPTHTVTFNPNGGTVSPTSAKITHEGTYGTLPTPTRTGYTFNYWTLNGTRIYSTTKVTSSHTLVANWTVNTYAVTFKDENGTTLKTENVNYGSKPTPPADPVKADTAQWKYTFDGWYDANGNKWSSSTTITAATTFTARYNSTVQTYTVRWFNHDGTLLETDTDVPYGTKPTYNGATPIKAGNAEHSYQFAGWNYDTENGITPSLGTTYIDITAQFREIDNTYKVTWVNDGVVIEEDEAVPYGDKPDYNGATPTKVSDAQYDYTFIGWSASVTDPAKPESELETVKGDITYTAVYSATIKFYTVRVILFDTDTTLVYEYGTNITLEAPAVIGYRFVKWTDGNTDNPRTVEVKGEATYQAVYERLPIPIFVNTEQVQAVYVNESTKTITYIIEGEIPTVNVTTDTVDGWHFEVSNTVPVDSHEVTAIYINETKIM